MSEESQGAPDLVVGTPTVSDSGPDAGATFTLSATVRNAGDESSAATTLRYYRSTDATITTSDTQEDTDEVAELAASGTSSESVSLTAPSTPGTYYYGACVDAVTGESDTTNNCSSSVPVTVPEPKPDLVVGAPSVSNSAPAVGATFTLSATVRNAGDESSAGHDVALLPFDGCDHHNIRHAGGHGRASRACGFGNQRRVGDPDRAVDCGDVLLRGVRGCGDGGVGRRPTTARRR